MLHGILTASKSSSFLNGFGDKSNAPSFVALNSFIDRRKSGEDNGDRAAFAFLQLFQNLEPSRSGIIKSRRIRYSLYHGPCLELRSVLARSTCTIPKSGGSTGITHDLLVVRHKYPSLVPILNAVWSELHPKMGSLPESLSTKILPPCSWMIP